MKDIRILLAGILLPCSLFVSNSAQAVNNCCPAIRTQQKTRTVCRPAKKHSSVPSWTKRYEKYSDALSLLKEIHEVQKFFLSKFDGKRSSISSADRNKLKFMIEALPQTVKNKNFPFGENMLFIEYTVYDILNGKEKYKLKKSIKTPEKLLEDIQKKQRRYIMKVQRLEMKRLKRRGK